MRLRRVSTGIVLALAAAALLAAVPRPATARDTDEHRRDEVRRAIEAGEIRSLADILNAVVAGVEIEHKDGHWLYELRVIDGQGRLFEVYIGARSGTIERIKEK